MPTTSTPTPSPTFPGPISPGRSATAIVPTVNASRYLIQMCKHFGHHIPTHCAHMDASVAVNDGRLEFEGGVCLMSSDDLALALTVRPADGAPAALERLQDVVARHLLRFAFREDLSVTWTPDAVAAG